MRKSAKIAVSLPREVVRSMEEARKQTGETRSAYVRRALELASRERQRRTQIERYLEGYHRFPETKKEIAAAESSAVALLASEPW